jgi:uncharacterized protein
MNRRQLGIAIVAVVLVTAIIAAALFVVYSPKGEDYSGIPTLVPYVTDDSLVLEDSDYYDLQDFCYAVELNNSCQVALLIVNTTGKYDLNTFALKTFEKNGIGQKGKDNGVLSVFLIANNETRWRTVTGKGVQDILSGFVLKGFENEYLIPNVQEGNLSHGITLYIFSIGLELDDKYKSPGSDPWNGDPIDFVPLTGWQWVIALVVLSILTVITKGRILMWIPWLLLGRGGGRGGFGGGGTGGGGSRGRL